MERAVAERFTALCVQKTAKLRLGPPSDPDAEVGPMIRLRQLEKVEEHLRDAVARGAKILAGGRRRPDLGPNFLEPAVIANVDHSMKIMREETFGPVLAIQAVANPRTRPSHSPTIRPSRSAAAFGQPTPRRGRELASRLRAGSVMVNDVASYYGISEAPHGGRGASGWGRTHSRFGLLEMVHTKYVDVDRLPRVAKPWWYGYTPELDRCRESLGRSAFCAKLAPPRICAHGAPGRPWRDLSGAIASERHFQALVLHARPFEVLISSC